MGLTQKKVVIVFNSLDIGGIETKIIDICCFYSEIKKIRVYLLLKNKIGKLLRNLPKSTVVISPGSKSFSKIKTITFPFWLAEQFRAIKPNLIISFGNYSSISSVLGNFFNKNHSKIIISDDSGLKKQIRRETFSIVREKLVKITYPMANEIIVLSDEGKKELTKLVPKTENKIIIRKNWLPLIYKKRNKILKKDIDILFLARFEPQKNPIKFLEIIKKIKNENDKIKVYMVGYGSLKEEIERFIKKNNLTKNVLVKGATLKPVDYYRRSKLLILTSDYEGFPLTILESFSGDCVPVSNKIPEINDFFEKYAEDILFTNIEEASRKILELLLNSKKREFIGDYYKNKIFLEQKIHFKETINEFKKYY